MLDVQDLHTYYDESHILQGISLRVASGECVAVLGPNGMGKTTTLRSIMGLTPARKGSVIFKEQDITKFPPFRIARLGIGYVPEDRGLFGDLTVVDNLRVPFLNLERHNAKAWKETEDRLYALFPVLRERKKQLAGSLSGGEQQMLATARAMISGREMILLDEPTEGLAPVVIQDLISVFNNIKEQGHTMLLVEQNMEIAAEVAERCYILEKGCVKVEESMEILSQSPDLIQRYIGVVEADAAE